MKPATPSSGSLFDADQFSDAPSAGVQLGTFSDLHDIRWPGARLSLRRSIGHRKDDLVDCHLGVAGAAEMG